MIDPKKVALTAINEALIALDHDVAEGLPSDLLVEEAMGLLLNARDLYTSKPWPEAAHPLLDEAAHEAWVEARAEEQCRDGRQ